MNRLSFLPDSHTNNWDRRNWFVQPATPYVPGPLEKIGAKLNNAMRLFAEAYDHVVTSYLRLIFMVVSEPGYLVDAAVIVYNLSNLLTRIIRRGRLN